MYDRNILLQKCVVGQVVSIFWDFFEEVIYELSLKEWVRWGKRYHKQRLASTEVPLFFRQCQIFFLFFLFLSIWSFFFLYLERSSSHCPFNPCLAVPYSPSAPVYMGALHNDIIESWFSITLSHGPFKCFFFDIISVYMLSSLWLTVVLEAEIMLSYLHITDKYLPGFLHKLGTKKLLPELIFPNLMT